MQITCTCPYAVALNSLMTYVSTIVSTLRFKFTVLGTLQESAAWNRVSEINSPCPTDWCT
jgi:hypothetical protein